jgi:putative transposase
MPRKPRYYEADIPCHVISRGNNRQACFFENDDYCFYLECLRDACARYRVALHAYVLMTNHVHLLMTPERKEGISQVMQSVGRRYVQYVNHRYCRSGTLWEGRHKASMVDQETYLLICYRYIELNPVRARMVEHPSYYRWSSYRENTGLDPQRYVKGHECYMRLGLDKSSREQSYQVLFGEALANHTLNEVRSAARFSMPLGDSRFRSQVENATGQKLGHAKRGRPPKRSH